MSVSGSKLGPAAKDAEGERTNPSQSTPPDNRHRRHHHTHSDMENKTTVDRVRRDHKKDNPGLSPSPKKTSRSSSTPAIYNFPPPKVPPPGGGLSIEAPMSPTFSTAPTIGSPSTNFRSGRNSPFPIGGPLATPTPTAPLPATGGAAGSPIRGIVDHPPLGPAPRKSSVVSLLHTEAGAQEHLVIHYPAKRASSPLAQGLVLPSDRFGSGNSPDEYDSSSDREDDDDDDDEVRTRTSGVGGRQQQPPVEGLPKSSSTNSTGGERPLSAGSPGLSSLAVARGSPSLGPRAIPGGGPPPPLNFTPGTRISLQFHTSTSSAHASSPSPTPSSFPTGSFSPSLPPLPPPLPTTRPPPLPVTPPPPLPPVAFRSLPSSPRSPAHHLGQPRSSFSTATTILESPDTGQPPPSPSSTWNQRSLSFSAASHPSMVAPSSSLSKPLPPTPLTNLKRSMSLDSQKELLVRRGSHRQLPQTPLPEVSTSSTISSTSTISSSSSSTSSTPATSAINSPSNSSTASTASPLPGTPSHTPPPGIASAEMMISSSSGQMSLPTYSPSLSPAPSPSPSPRTLDVNIPASPIPTSKSLGSMTSPAHLQGSSPSIHSINRFKPRSMSQPWMLPPSSPGVYSSSSSSSLSESMDGTPSSVLSSSSSTSTSLGGSPSAFTPPPLATSLSHQDLLKAKFNNRFHSSFDDTPPMLSSGGTNLTEIQEVPEEEEREREKEKLILEKEMENSHSGVGGTNSRRSSVGAATTRPPSPSSRSNSSPTVSITKEVLMSRSASSSAGSGNYSLSSLHPHALLWGQREATSFFNRPKEWKCARCKIKYPPLEHSWHCLPDKFFLCNICFNATQVTSE